MQEHSFSPANLVHGRRPDGGEAHWFLDDVSIGLIPDAVCSVDGIIPEGVTEVHGPPGSRKSFLVIAMSIATGTE